MAYFEVCDDSRAGSNSKARPSALFDEFCRIGGAPMADRATKMTVSDKTFLCLADDDNPKISAKDIADELKGLDKLEAGTTKKLSDGIKEHYQHALNNGMDGDDAIKRLQKDINEQLKGAKREIEIGEPPAALKDEIQKQLKERKLPTPEKIFFVRLKVDEKQARGGTVVLLYQKKRDQ